VLLPVTLRVPVLPRVLLLPPPPEREPALLQVPPRVPPRVPRAQ
jgi:hypothetical protein